MSGAAPQPLEHGPHHGAWESECRFDLLVSAQVLFALVVYEAA